MDPFGPIETEIWSVDPDRPDAERLSRAGERIRAGALVAFPTETVYGLGANALDAEAVARIFIAKGRPARNPLIVHATDMDAARGLTSQWPEIATRLADRFWPGPLTLVLPRHASVPNVVTGGGNTVGIRVPAHPIAHALLRSAGVPIAAPSANRSEQLSPTQAAHVLRSLGGRIPLILDGGQTTGGLESTVLDLASSLPTLLRPGLIEPAEIEAIIGPIARISRRADTENPDPLPSPGLLSRHYAPRASLELTRNGLSRVRELCAQGAAVGWLTFHANALPPPGVHKMVMPGEAAGYAARLFASLHTIDALGVTHIVVDVPPDTDAWLAVNDRLRRAAAASPENIET